MLIHFKINLIILKIWWFFVAIEPAEPPVGPVNQWASHLTGSLTVRFLKLCIYATQNFVDSCLVS
jgi:hypothetical protein